VDGIANEEVHLLICNSWFRLTREKRGMSLVTIQSSARFGASMSVLTTLKFGFVNALSQELTIVSFSGS
jgi:hypothetical protein